jgi:hypothetical protein
MNRACAAGKAPPSALPLPSRLSLATRVSKVRPDIDGHHAALGGSVGAVVAGMGTGQAQEATQLPSLEVTASKPKKESAGRQSPRRPRRRRPLPGTVQDTP